MWPLSKPIDGAGDTFSICLDRIRDPALKTRLLGAKNAVVLAEELYNEKASINQLHTIASSTTVGAATKAEMVAIYDFRMAAKRSPGRHVYDRLKVVPHDRCPYCAHRDVSTLDHFLDKAVHPALAVTPINLVPSCIECNKAKSGKLPTNASDALFHPYYDNFGNFIWLVGEVIQTSPAALVFSVAPVPEWSAEILARATHHFSTFGLGQLYSIQAARELSLIRRNLAVQHAAGGPDQVRAELLRQYRSRAAASPNSWQAAAYNALALSDWFCDGGFA